LPGAGQLYNGQRGKAALLAAGWWPAAALCVLTLTQPFSNWLLLGTLLFWVLIWNDAVVTAVRIQGGDWTTRNSVAVFFAGMFYAGLLATALQFLLPTLVALAVFLWLSATTAMGRSRGSRYPVGLRSMLIGTAVFITVLALLIWKGDTQRIFTFVAVIKKSQEPMIAKGDKVFVNNAAYWFGEPRIGDVIHFDPARFTAQRGSNIYSINIQDYFQRVSALPGDLLEKRGGEMLRNGMPLPEDLRPNGWQLMPDWKYEVPAGRYFAPVTHVPDDIISGAFMSMLGGGSTPSLSEGLGGMILQGWKEAAMVSKSAIKGRAVAIANPPVHRCWLRPRAGGDGAGKE
jgi:signal peptidase I